MADHLRVHHCHQGPLLGGGLRSTSARFPAMTSVRTHEGQTLTLNVPSLRQVSQTAPYFFDGRVATLPAVLQQYAQGQFADVPGFPMTAEQEQALLAFLRAL